MTTKDAKRLSRTAQILTVEVRHGKGSPPSYSGWEPVGGAKVDRITINRDGTPSTATIWFPELRWHEPMGFLLGDNIRIQTNEGTVVFAGFFTDEMSDFSGGDGGGKAYERNAILCQDYRWLLSITSPIYGQVARGPDDYTDYGTPEQLPIKGSFAFLSGQRTIFNKDGRPNRDTVVLESTQGFGDMPIFGNPRTAEYWTAGDMIKYILSPLYNNAYQYLPIPSPGELAGLGHGDWYKVLGHISVEGLNAIDAIQLICRHLGWGFRQDCSGDSDVTFVFYKIGEPPVRHWLHAPAVDERIDEAVESGKKMLWSMSLSKSIAAVVNDIWGLGAPHRLEFTAELVPAWLDEQFTPDTSDDNANLFFTQAQLQDITDPNSKDYYKYYHPRGSDFRRTVGRKWALNESGRYTKESTYDRGEPFDFKLVTALQGATEGEPTGYVLSNGKRTYAVVDAYDKRNYAGYDRQLLPCLTVDPEDLNSVGIKVEFSFDGGETWQTIPCAVTCLKDEAGIYIEEANLAEIVDEAEGTISEGDLDGVQLNYFTSLADDKLDEERSFFVKEGEEGDEWKTRVRVTASIQLDQRLCYEAFPSASSGSPFFHSTLYDFSSDYGLTKRTKSSVFDSSSLPAYEINSTEWFGEHLESIRHANEDMSVSGEFVLDRMWLGDGSGSPDFAIGDAIERIIGREYSLSAALGEQTVYPEIIQIIYLPDKQKQMLVTRDLRYAQPLR